MSKKNREPVSDSDAEARALAHLKKFKKKYPTFAKESEPTGRLNGKFENLSLPDDELEDLEPEELRDRFKVHKNNKPD